MTRVSTCFIILLKLQKPQNQKFTLYLAQNDLVISIPHLLKITYSFVSKRQNISVLSPLWNAGSFSRNNFKFIYCP